MLATITGEVSMLFATMPSALPHVKSGKLKALAVTSPKRASAVPNLPTMIEAGLKDFEVSIWVGMLVPSGTPSNHIAKLNEEIAKALKSPQVIGQLRARGYDPVGNSPANMASVIKAESAMWSRVIKGAGIQAN